MNPTYIDPAGAEALRADIVEKLADQVIYTVQTVMAASGVADTITDEQAREWAAEAFDEVLKRAGADQ